MEKLQVFELLKHKLGRLRDLEDIALVLLDAAVVLPREFEHLLLVVDCKNASHCVVFIRVRVHESLLLFSVHFKRTDAAVLGVHQPKITDE